MTTGLERDNGMVATDEFDRALNEALREMANPALPEGLKFGPRRLVNETGAAAGATAPATGSEGRVLAPEVFFSYQERMRGPRDLRSTVIALVTHAAAIALVFWAVARHVQFASPVKTVAITELAPPPPQAPPKATQMGGGGGQRSPTPVSKGALPKFADTQITPPAPPPLQQPKIKMPDPTIEVQKDLKMANNNMPNFGMPNSPLIGNSMGNGSGTGIGSGNGSGLGPGSGGNYGGGPRRIGGGVSAPQLIYQVDPEFSEEARKAKFMGIVTVNLWVDEHGNPTHVHVVRGVGMGLDEKAVEAVKQYKFKPAMEGGKPVLVELNVEVNFQIF